MKLPSLDKVAFVLSICAFVWLHGFATSARQWFPNDLLTTGWDQIQSFKQAILDDDHVATVGRVYDREGAQVVDRAAIAPGLTLVPSIWKDLDWNPGLKLIDIDGKVVHQWEVRPTQIFPSRFDHPLLGLLDMNEWHEPKNSYLFPNGDVLVVIDEIGTARLDACGRTKWRIEANHHHSLTRAENGTFWVSGRAPERRPHPFSSAEAVRHDLLIHLSEDGEVLKEVKVFEILKNNKALLERFFQFHQPQDTHLNDVEALSSSMEQDYPLFEGGDLLVSLKHLNLVFVVDPATLKVKWWTGEPFIQQHDPDFVGDGWIGVFDNYEDGTDRGTRLGGSRVVAFQPHSDSTAIWFRSSNTNRLYTHNRGNWQLLENGNLLMTESTAGRVVEVTPDGQLVWEWIQQSYDEASVPIVSRAARYYISRDQISSWPCST